MNDEAEPLATHLGTGFVPASRLNGTAIGALVMVSVPACAGPESVTVVGTLTDVETQPVGTRMAHVALHNDGRLCTGRTTARRARVVVFLAGHQIFLPPDHPVLVHSVGG